jgi:hypothetical protein
MTGAEEIMAVIQAAEVFETPAGSLDEAIARLGALTPLEYDQIRETEAERLRVRVTTLDDEVKKIRKKTLRRSTMIRISSPIPSLGLIRSI